LVFPTLDTKKLFVCPIFLVGFPLFNFGGSLSSPELWPSEVNCSMLTLKSPFTTLSTVFVRQRYGKQQPQYYGQ
jgi:hypothetical protein